MIRLNEHPEDHLVERIGWLRAAVLGANDGIISTASLIVGVAAAAATRNDVLIAGIAGLVAGAMSMAAGEYVSVSSQSDTELAKDALKVHAHDELGISEVTADRPVQAALTSAAMFSIGAAMPLLMVVIAPASALVPVVSAASLGFLALLGAVGAKAGGAHIQRATIRVTFWGALALATTAVIGKLFGTVI